jgi:hypothetical protein
MYNETCSECKLTGNEYLIDDLCSSCAGKRIINLESQLAESKAEVERLKMCYKTAIGGEAGGCGKGEIVRIECKEMQELRAALKKIKKLKPEVVLGWYMIKVGPVNDIIDKALALEGETK